MDDLKKFITVYTQEAEELISEVEEALIEIEEHPEDKEKINQVFRAVHTIKGSGAMFGFNDIVDFTHDLETVLDKVRGGAISASKGLIDLLFKSSDHIKSILDYHKNGNKFDPQKGEYIRSKLIEIFSPLKDQSAEKDSPNIHEVHEKDQKGKEKTYRIRFRPHRDIFFNGTDPSFLLDEIRDMGDCKITPHFSNIPTLGEIVPENCYLSWDIILTTNQGMDSIKDVFIFVEDNCELNIELINELADLDEFPQPMRLGEILVDRKDLPEETITDVLCKQKRLGDLLVESKLVDQEVVVSALAEQNHIKTVLERRRDDGKASGIRVAPEKLDVLVDLVGELVTTQARLSQFSLNHDNQELMSIAEEVERLTSELRDNTMSIRMMPIGLTFSNFKRLVRDLSSELGKEIELTVEGAETELDKTVIDRLRDPLMHLIRNSIDHGIESPGKRVEKGKPAKGTILLRAEHKGSFVVITIEDNGQGLNVQAIKAKAAEKGLISKDADIPDKEAFDLIFAPGFSTAETVSNISGRGVGMDVVKKTVDSLRGSIEINSSLGKGTRIKLKLPLTLAIINGLLVKIGAYHYVIPLAAVQECVELNRDNGRDFKRSNILNIRGEMIPYLSLRDQFNIEGNRPTLEHVVIADVHDKRIGFVVDNVIGGHQTVIKSLGPAFKEMKNLSGATILGDGTVALIIDINTFI